MMKEMLTEHTNMIILTQERCLMPSAYNLICCTVGEITLIKVMSANSPAVHALDYYDGVSCWHVVLGIPTSMSDCYIFTEI